MFPYNSLLIYVWSLFCCCSFFFNDPATTEIYTLSLHDALPIWSNLPQLPACVQRPSAFTRAVRFLGAAPWSSFTQDRKSTRLNSSHVEISYAVFCLKKKKKRKIVVYHKIKIKPYVETPVTK